MPPWQQHEVHARHLAVNLAPIHVCQGLLCISAVGELHVREALGQVDHLVNGQLHRLDLAIEAEYLLYVCVSDIACEVANHQLCGLPALVALLFSLLPLW